ncbi:MAG: head GIN domain-containing protein [Cyclobacteriaceae bacterium]
MKTKIAYLALMSCLLTATTVLANLPVERKDTVTIDLGNNSKIVIYFEDKDELRTIQDYDINQMLKDLSISIDSAENAEMLIIKDSTGTRYLQDTVIEIDHYDDDFYESITQPKVKYDLSEFNEIDIGQAFEMEVSPGDAYQLIVTAKKESDLEDMLVVLEDKTLKVMNNPNFNINQSIFLYISTPELKEVKLSEAANAEVKRFSSDKFRIKMRGASSARMELMADLVDVDMSGASELSLKGAGEYLNAEISGASEFTASNFPVNDAKVQASGASEVMVNASSLNGEAKGGSEILNVYNKQDLEQNMIYGNEEIRIKIGNMEIVANTDELEEEWEDVEDLEDIKEKTHKEEYIDQEVPKARHTVNFDFGMNNYLQNGNFPDADGADYAVRPWGSWYVGINSVHKFHMGGSLFLEWGKGVSWYNFKFENDAMRINRVDNQINFEPDARDISPIKSKLVVSHLNMSLVPMIDLSKGYRKVKSLKGDGFEYNRRLRQGFRFGIGPYLGYRLNDRTKFVYRNDGRNRDKDNGNFMTSTLRYGLRTQLGYKGWDIFINYDLNNLFSGINNPQLNAFSFGLTF